MDLMTDAEWTRAKAVLNDLLDAAPDDATAWLQERYADEPEFRADVESLYRAYRNGAIRDHEGAATWLQPSAGGASTAGGSSSGTRPSRESLSGLPMKDEEADGHLPRHGQETVGRYRLIEKIGDGGMGVVYRAERSDGAFERPVAVKLLRRIVSSETERRFRAERQVLASLDHPNIAGLIDGGVTAEGRLYLVMELVDGTPITEYARTHSLTASERVELLTQVIDAVYAAHQTLVVHRDLKPSNVLVTETDAGPQVKLVDFGIAKILDEALPVTRPVTRTGHALMTPVYAAPEQIAGDEISTATDTYQLGVLAYELLTGRPPLVDGETERRQIERRILKSSPDPPSSQPATQGIDPRRLGGDLDTILLKALRKEPGRRYASPDAMRRDLRRHQNDKPIEARPATLSYRTKKFVRRNQWGVVTGAAVLCLTLVLGGFIVLERNAAERQARKAEEVSSFLVQLFEAADPNRAAGDSVTVRALLDRGQDRLHTINEPAAKGQMAHVLGQTYRRLGEFEKARTLLQTSVRVRSALRGDDHPETLESMSALGLLERDQGRYAAADTLMERVVTGRRALRGPTDSTVVQALMYHGFIQRKLRQTEEAEKRLEAALRAHRSRRDTANILTAELLFNLASLLKTQGKLDEALPVQRRSLHLVDSLTNGPHPGRIANLNNLALLQTRRGDLDAADGLYKRLLAEGTEVYGPEHPNQIRWLSNLGSLHTEMFEYERADSLLNRALALSTKMRDGPHPQTAVTLHNLAINAYERGDFSAADSIYPRALAMMRSVHAQPDRRTARVTSDYGLLLGHMEQFADAEAMLHQSRRALQSIHEEKAHPETGNVLLRLGRLRLAQDRPSDADSITRASLRHFRSKTDTSTSGLFGARLLEARAAVALGESNRAHVLGHQAASLLESLPDSESWRRHILQTVRGEIALERDSLIRAKHLLEQAYAGLRETRGLGNVHTVAAREAHRTAEARNDRAR